jgi:hypothetical protein
MCAGTPLTRKDLGLPDRWDLIADWIDDSRDIAKSVKIPNPEATCKNPDVPVLSDYSRKAPDSFWKTFPSNYPETFRQGGVNVKRLKSLAKTCETSWTLAERHVARKAIRKLEGKDPVVLTRALPEMFEKNAKSAIENRKAMTDVLATWLKKGFVAGPFDEPPVDGFRANPLMAAVQRFKVRPIMNLSSPKGGSLNDAVKETEIHLLEMSSAKLFGETLQKAGKGAVFSKQDIQETYKLIPNAKEQWHLYGFEWLGKYFFDTTTVFGSKAAPASFDPLPETIVNIVCTLGKIPKNSIHRQLDDVPMVAPKGSGLTEKFTKLYKETCEAINVPLAPECERHEKAFGPTTFGTVLGIQFDSEQMTWSLPAEKEASIQNVVDEFLEKKTCSLLEIQRLHGKLSDFALSCEFMLGFRHHLISLLGKFGGHDDPSQKRLIPDPLKQDLWIWNKVQVGIPHKSYFWKPPFELNPFCI